MNDSNTTQQTEFVWRRLVDSLNVFGRELDGHYWLLVLIPVLLLGLGMATASAAFPRSQQPLSPVAPVDPAVPGPAASGPSSSSKTGRGAKNHSHADDFLIIGTVFNQQSLAFPGARLILRL